MNRKEQVKNLSILLEVSQERKKQELEFGIQNWPILDQTLLNREGSCSPDRMAQEYEIPSETRAKFMLENASENSKLTYFHILIEEVCEAMASLKDLQAMRKELIQVASVAVAMIDSIDNGLYKNE